MICFLTPDGMLTVSSTAGSLNFRDVMLAYGKLSKDLMSHGHGGHQIGLEFSGKVESLRLRLTLLVLPVC